jgi:serine/threonine protein kinase
MPPITCADFLKKVEEKKGAEYRFVLMGKSKAWKFYKKEEGEALLAKHQAGGPPLDGDEDHKDGPLQHFVGFAKWQKPKYHFLIEEGDLSAAKKALADAAKPLLDAKKLQLTDLDVKPAQPANDGTTPASPGTTTTTTTTPPPRPQAPRPAPPPGGHSAGEGLPPPVPPRPARTMGHSGGEVSPPTAPPKPAPPPPARPTTNPRELYDEQRKEIKELINHAEVFHPHELEPLKKLLAKAKVMYQNGSWQSAAALLEQAQKSTQANFGKEKDKFSEQRKYLEPRKEIKELLTHVGIFFPDKLDPLHKLLVKADQLAEEGKWNEAVALLEHVKQSTRAMFKTAKWSANVGKVKYTIEADKPLSSGAAGAVYPLKASSNDNEAPRLVLKVANKDVLNRFETMLAHEAEFYKKLGDHPNIARCYGFQEYESQDSNGTKVKVVGMVLETLSGGSVNAGMKKMQKDLETGKMTPEDYFGTIQFTLVRTLEALEFIAAKGYVHLDIKPDNIMFDGKRGEVKLVDMGTVTFDGDSGAAGTHGFQAPEVDGSHMVSSKADIFSVGAMAYEAGMGKRFDYNPKVPGQEDWKDRSGFGAATGGDAKALHAEGGEPEVMQKYIDFVNRLMHPDPAQRLSARDALNDPFLKDRLIDDDKARQIIKGLNQPRTDAPPPAPADPHDPHGKDKDKSEKHKG